TIADAMDCGMRSKSRSIPRTGSRPPEEVSNDAARSTNTCENRRGDARIFGSATGCGRPIAAASNVETLWSLRTSRKGQSMMSRAKSRTPGPNKLPVSYLQFQKKYPKVFQALDALGATTAEAGPLDDKT